MAAAGEEVAPAALCRPELWPAPRAPLAGSGPARAEARLYASPPGSTATLAGQGLGRSSVTPATPEFFDLGQNVYLNLDFSS